jgi:hypothetical protein
MEYSRSGCTKLEVKADMIVGGQHCTSKIRKMGEKSNCAELWRLARHD